MFATTGGMGKKADIALKKLALELADHHMENVSHVLGLLRCRISFALMRAAHVCLRGSRSSRVRYHDNPADLIIREANVDY